MLLGVSDRGPAKLEPFDCAGLDDHGRVEGVEKLPAVVSGLLNERMGIFKDPVGLVLGGG